MTFLIIIQRELQKASTTKWLSRWRTKCSQVWVRKLWQDMDTSGYQVSDLDNFEFYAGKDQLDVDADFRQRIDTHISPSTFNDFELGSVTENPILID